MHSRNLHGQVNLTFTECDVKVTGVHVVASGDDVLPEVPVGHVGQGQGRLDAAAVVHLEKGGEQ